MPTDLPPRRAADPEPDPGLDPEVGARSEPKRRDALQGVQGVILSVTLLAMLAVVLLPVLRPDGGRAEPLRVAVAEPLVERAPGASAEVVSPEQLERIAEAARDAMERHLVGRKWLLPVDVESADEQTDEQTGDDPDETLRLELRCAADGHCRGTLQRVRSIDGSSPWQKGRVDLPVGDPREVDRALEREIQIAYLRFPRHDDAPQLYAERADYERYLDLRRRLRTGIAPASLLPLSETLVDESPRFAAAYRLQAELLLDDLGEAVDDDEATRRLERAARLLARAHQIAPADPRPLERLADVERSLGRVDAADEAAQRLEALRRERRWLPRESDPSRSTRSR